MAPLAWARGCGACSLLGDLFQGQYPASETNDGACPEKQSKSVILSLGILQNAMQQSVACAHSSFFSDDIL